MKNFKTFDDALNNAFDLNLNTFVFEGQTYYIDDVDDINNHKNLDVIEFNHDSKKWQAGREIKPNIQTLGNKLVPDENILLNLLYTVVDTNQKNNNDFYAQSGGLLKSISKNGYNRDSIYKNNPYNDIYSSNITLANTDIPLKGISDKGEIQIMYPGNDYHFKDATVVRETPLYQSGDTTSNLQKVGNVTFDSNSARPYQSQIGNVKIDEKDNFGNPIYEVTASDNKQYKVIRRKDGSYTFFNQADIDGNNNVYQEPIRYITENYEKLPNSFGKSLMGSLSGVGNYRNMLNSQRTTNQNDGNYLNTLKETALSLPIMPSTATKAIPNVINLSKVNRGVPQMLTNTSKVQLSLDGLQLAADLYQNDNQQNTEVPLEGFIQYESGGYLKDNNTYVTKEGKQTKRGLWANVHLKKQRKNSYQEGGEFDPNKYGTVTPYDQELVNRAIRFNRIYEDSNEPQIRFEDRSDGRSRYNQGDKTIYLSKPEDLLSELPHAYQDAQNLYADKQIYEGDGVPYNDLTITYQNAFDKVDYDRRERDLENLENTWNNNQKFSTRAKKEGMVFLPKQIIRKKLLDSWLYETPGTAEYEAHQELEPAFRKYVNTGKYQAGGSTIDNIRQFYTTQLSTPEYRERFKKESTELTEEEITAELESMKEGINTIKLKKGKDYEYSPENDLIYYTNDPELNREESLVHEFSHKKRNDNISYRGKYTDKDNIEMFNQANIRNEHDRDIDERASDLDVLRYKLFKDKIIDSPYKTLEDIDMPVIQDYLNNSDDYFLQRIKRTSAPNKLKELLNTYSNVDYSNKIVKQQYAQVGGSNKKCTTIESILKFHKSQVGEEVNNTKYETIDDDMTGQYNYIDYSENEKQNEADDIDFWKNVEDENNLMFSMAEEVKEKLRSRQKDINLDISETFSSGQKGESASIRNNSPLNQKYSPYMASLGATRGNLAKEHDGTYEAHFNNINDGINAAKSLWNTPNYKNKTVREGLQRWSASTYDKGIYNELSDIVNKPVSQLTEQEKNRLIKAQVRFEDGQMYKKLYGN